MRKWHLSDPPDESKRDGKNLIEDVHGNRNLFIDHPEMVERVRDY
jgi:endonuclease I